MPEEKDNLFTLAAKTMCVPIHPAGHPFIIIAIVLALLLMQVGAIPGFIGLVLALWCVYFFRNPKRVTPEREGLIVSPADGVVQMIVEAPLPPEIADAGEEGDPLFAAEKVTRVSVFLNVFDVHVNRMPVDGTLTKVIYHPGKFFNASLDKASLENERSTILMKMSARSASIAFVQIAGLIARRIICTAEAEQEVKAGDVYGIIRFGSRVDIFLPQGVAPMVCVGQRMVGGETIIADLTSSETQRMGSVRG